MGVALPSIPARREAHTLRAPLLRPAFIACKPDTIFQKVVLRQCRHSWPVTVFRTSIRSFGGISGTPGPAITFPLLVRTARLPISSARSCTRGQAVHHLSGHLASASKFPTGFGFVLPSFVIPGFDIGLPRASAAFHHLSLPRRRLASPASLQAFLDTFDGRQGTFHNFGGDIRHLEIFHFSRDTFPYI